MVEFSKNSILSTDTVENYKVSPSENLTQELGRYQSFSFPPHPIPIFEVPESGKIGIQEALNKLEKFGV